MKNYFINVKMNCAGQKSCPRRSVVDAPFLFYEAAASINKSYC